jgi:hypothetical protein
MTKKILYIGLNGYAGSGKDTVAKMLYHILKQDWMNFSTCRKAYKQNANELATFNDSILNGSDKVMCIAFADQLKEICSKMFGIPVDRFYYNKGNAWIAINSDFEYTEVRPLTDYTVTAEEYNNGYTYYSTNKNKYWMSLREVLVYVGTYVCQASLNPNMFVNIVNNKIKQQYSRYGELEYVIVTDVRFLHELEYIQKKSGITINVVRDNVQQMDNIAEHDLDDEEDFDFCIENNGTYDDLFKEVWNLVHNNAIFLNETVNLYSRDDNDNYLRLIDRNGDNEKYILCCDSVNRTSHASGNISMLDPVGGPAIYVDQEIQANKSGLIATKIYYPDNGHSFYIDVKKKS